MIQRGYIILIIGGVIFVAGIIMAAIWAIPFASTFLQNNTLINQVSIEPSRSVEATTQVTDVSRPISVAIHIERLEGVVRLIETVKDPSGTVVSNNEFSANLFTTFQPQTTGNHVLNITNAGAGSVAIDATFGYMPFIMAPASNSGEGGSAGTWCESQELVCNHYWRGVNCNRLFHNHSRNSNSCDRWPKKKRRTRTER